MTSQGSLLAALVFVSLLLASTALPLYPSSAAPSAITAGEVMAEVNALRRSRGFEPYSVDLSITAYAQEHSEFQARIGQSTHLHSDGMTSLASHGYLENVAGGTLGYLTAQTVVYEIWADPVHGKTMIGYDSGSAGVGVASDSTTTYVTLNVLPGGDAAPTVRGGSPTPDLLLTPIALVPLRAATMKPNGVVIHEVGYGQSLWAIALAYGVSAARIRELNGMAPGDTAIWAGQRLLIVPAGVVTPTPVEPGRGETSAPTTSGPSPLGMRVSPTPSPNRSAFQAVSTTPPLPGSSHKESIRIDPVLTGLIGLATLGFILVISSGVKIRWGGGRAEK